MSRACLSSSSSRPHKVLTLETARRPERLSSGITRTTAGPSIYRRGWTSAGSLNFPMSAEATTVVVAMADTGLYAPKYCGDGVGLARSARVLRSTDPPSQSPDDVQKNYLGDQRLHRRKLFCGRHGVGASSKTELVVTASQSVCRDLESRQPGRSRVARARINCNKYKARSPLMRERCL